MATGYVKNLLILRQVHICWVIILIHGNQSLDGRVVKWAWHRRFVYVYGCL